MIPVHTSHIDWSECHKLQSLDHNNLLISKAQSHLPQKTKTKMARHSYQYMKLCKHHQPKRYFKANEITSPLLWIENPSTVFFIRLPQKCFVIFLLVACNCCSYHLSITAPSLCLIFEKLPKLVASKFKYSIHVETSLVYSMLLCITTFQLFSSEHKH